jgi:hypothetical protein
MPCGNFSARKQFVPVEHFAFLLGIPSASQTDRDNATPSRFPRFSF